MKVITRSTILAMALLLAPLVVQATSSLSFEGSGYWIDMATGEEGRPTIPSIKFHAPGDKPGTVLQGNYEVKIFDIGRKELIIEYEGADPRVKPFTLVVNGERAVLRIAGTRIVSPFNWHI